MQKKHVKPVCVNRPVLCEKRNTEHKLRRTILIENKIYKNNKNAEEINYGEEREGRTKALAEKREQRTENKLRTEEKSYGEEQCSKKKKQN